MVEKMAQNKHFEYVKSSGGIDEYRLKKNDLSTLFMEDRSTPVVAVMVTYAVGSRNEAVGHTGATHLLEHLMFKGSKNFNNKNNKNVDFFLGERGALMNATTWLDRTNYYEVLPSEHLEDALALEADRMRHAFIRERDRQSEMTVVRNEYERGENLPLEALDKQMWAVAFQAHPYHHPTIGWRADIENVPIARLKRFYDTFYWPNNATLTMIGDFDRVHAFSLIQKYFGAHSASSHEIPRVYTQEPPQEGERRVVVSRSGETAIVGMGFKTPRGLHEDMNALQILATILIGGKSSRLYRALIDKGIATDLAPLVQPFQDPGLFLVYAMLAPGVSHEKAEGIMAAEFARIASQGVTADEVSRAQAQITASLALSRDGAFAIASALNEAIAIGDWTYYTTFGDKITKLTPALVSEAAARYFVENMRTIGWFVPKNGKQIVKKLNGRRVHGPLGKAKQKGQQRK